MSTNRLPMTISVVILSWNRRHEIEEVLDRVRDLFDGEIVVVDQGSTDGSGESLATRDDIRLLGLEENVGVAEGRNLGNRHATGDIVLSIDSDAALQPGFSFSALREAFEADPALAAVAFRILDPRAKREEWPHAMSVGEADHPFESTRFPGGGHAIRRSAFLEVEGYDPALFFYWEEMDLSVKLIATGSKIMYRPEFVVEHRPSDQERVTWAEGRFYYRTRNRVYLVRKYFRGWSRFRELVIIAVAYLAVGAREGLFREAMSGVWEGFRMAMPADVDELDLDRFYEVWTRLERRNRPGPIAWMAKTRRLVRGR